MSRMLVYLGGMLFGVVPTSQGKFVDVWLGYLYLILRASCGILFFVAIWSIWQLKNYMILDKVCIPDDLKV